MPEDARKAVEGWPPELWVDVEDENVSEIFWGDEKPEESMRRYVPESSPNVLSVEEARLVAEALSFDDEWKHKALIDRLETYAKGEEQ